MLINENVRRTYTMAKYKSYRIKSLQDNKLIIDSDYADNPDNEGHIYFQFINLSPFSIKLQKGDLIGQGIIKSYLTTDDDCANGKRVGGFGSTSSANNSDVLSDVSLI